MEIALLGLAGFVLNHLKEKNAKKKSGSNLGALPESALRVTRSALVDPDGDWLATPVDFRQKQQDQES